MAEKNLKITCMNKKIVQEPKFINMDNIGEKSCLKIKNFESSRKIHQRKPKYNFKDWAQPFMKKWQSKLNDWQ